MNKIKLLITILIIYILCVFIVLSGIAIKHIKQTTKINIEEYTTYIDYGILNQSQINVFNNIIDAVETNEDTIESTIYFSDRARHEILTQLGLYYGSTENIHEAVEWYSDRIVLNLELLKELADKKIIIDARIDEAVSMLLEGSNKYKLWQISRYVTDKINYTKEQRETIGALNGKGVCINYAMIFYKMATRLGINTYICYGYAGGYHAWNAVDLDGELIFYDVTWYDSLIYNIRFIHSRTSWDRDFQVNNKWASDLKDNK